MPRARQCGPDGALCSFPQGRRGTVSAGICGTCAATGHLEPEMRATPTVRAPRCPWGKPIRPVRPDYRRGAQRCWARQRATPCSTGTTPVPVFAPKLELGALFARLVPVFAAKPGLALFSGVSRLFSPPSSSLAPYSRVSRLARPASSRRANSLANPPRPRAPRARLRHSARTLSRIRHDRAHRAPGFVDGSESSGCSDGPARPAPEPESPSVIVATGVAARPDRAAWNCSAHDWRVLAASRRKTPF